MLREKVREYSLDWGGDAPHRFNCAEVMFRAINDTYDLKLGESELKLASGFGGGMCVESVCGILTGAIMGMSAAFSNDAPPYKCSALSEKVKALMESFEDAFGSIECAAIRDRGCCSLLVEAADRIEEVWNTTR